MENGCEEKDGPIFRQIAAQVSSKSRDTPPLYSLHREGKRPKRPSMLVRETTSYLPVVIENIGWEVVCCLFYFIWSFVATNKKIQEQALICITKSWVLLCKAQTFCSKMNDCICFRNSLWTGKTVGEEGIKKGRKQCSVTETGGSFVINIFCQAGFLLI